jgi:hypothetical protein
MDLTKYLSTPQASITFGAVSLVASAVLSGAATYVVMNRLRDNDDLLASIVDPRSKYLEIAKMVLPPYVPAVLSAGIGLYFIASGTNTYAQQYAAATTAYVLLSDRLSVVSEQAKLKLGPRAYSNLIDASNSATELKSRPTKSMFDSGGLLIYEPMSDRYFTSDSVDTVRRCVLRANEQLFSEGFIPVNHMFLELGLPGILWGDDSGWYVENGTIKADFGSNLVEYDGVERPVAVLIFSTSPELVAIRGR